MKTSSSGGGTSKNSPYISCSGTTNDDGTPAAIGWPGATVQTVSTSSWRHCRSHDVPIRRLNGLEWWPECRTTSPMPDHTRETTAETTSSDTRSCAS
jgi:hypothetical protein